MSNNVRVVFTGWKTGNSPVRCFSVPECREFTVNRLAALGIGEDRLGPQVGQPPAEVAPPDKVAEMNKYIQSAALNGKRPQSEPITNLPPVETRVCVPSLPSYDHWKRNHGIAMNPYQRSRKVGFWRISKLGERHTKYLVGYSSLSVPSSYLGWTDVVRGGSFGETWYAEFRVEITLDYWTLSSSHNGLLLAQKVIVDRTDPDLTDLVVTKLLAEAAKADFDMSTELAELGDALAMLKSLAPDLIKNLGRLGKLASRIPAYWFSKAGRRKLRQLIREGKTIPDLLAEYWMLYRYGIMPAYYAVEDIKKALKRKSAQFVTERTGDSKDDFRVARRPPTSTSVVEEQIYTTAVKTHGVWKARGLDLAAKQAQTWLPTTALELVPFSWVIGWFVNVGDWIQSLRPISSTASKYSISVKTENKFEIQIRQDPTEVKTVVKQEILNFGSFYIYVNGTYVKNRPQAIDTAYSESMTAFQRAVDTGSRTITTDVNFNLRRALDSLALLWQFVLK